jgi:hypothetical protein
MIFQDNKLFIVELVVSVVVVHNFLATLGPQLQAI